MLIGYARASIFDQTLAQQHDALSGAGCARIFEDRITGSKALRPGLSRVFAVARSGDVLVVWRLDRLGRSLRDLIDLMGKLKRRGIGLKSLQESIDTTSDSGKAIFPLFDALAEFERNLNRERTRARLNAASAEGRRTGRPKRLAPAKRRLAVSLYHQREQSVDEICRMMGISKPTLYKYVEEADE
ncbi:resolvase domain protein [Methylocaldum marinum]|uniref:Resolvase domain protein n=1 Tax=Methylocaldum marinum TaxID=1432792 RepID=A0A250KX54_9GAMM|nr:recombinase family protein [Methylocaldum marinum]BBA36243.1 resolvase domain protein [Methylocaldum marinum]